MRYGVIFGKRDGPFRFDFIRVIGAARPILLAVQKSLLHKLPALPSGGIPYGAGLKVQDVLDALGGVRHEE